jgi:membrane protease YdiL (CAAX protease family)
MITIALSHLLAAYAILAAPWLGCYSYRKARERIASGAPDAKVRLYRDLAVEQILTTAVVLFIWRHAQLSAASLGLVAPRSWGWSLATLVVVVGALAWSSFRLRPRAAKIRKQLEGSLGALLPGSHRERSWWSVISVGAGISEELAFRGFLFYYFATYVPQLNTLEKVLLTSLCFGLGHIYQGWRGAISTGILGLAFAGLYVITGSLLLPIVLHAMVDLRALLIFPPEASDPEPVGAIA